MSSGLPWPRLALKFPGFCARKPDPVTAGLLELCSSFHGGGRRSEIMVIFKGETVFMCPAARLVLRHEVREQNKMKETEVHSFIFIFHSYNFVCVGGRTLKIYTLIKFQECSSVLLISSIKEIPRTYSSSQWKFCSLDHTTSPSPVRSQPLASTVLLSASARPTFLDSTHKWYRAVLCFWVWLISLSLMSSRFSLLHMTGSPFFFF